MASELSVALDSGLLTAANQFSLDLTKNVASETEGNFVSSALSAFMVLAMVTAGSGGNTKIQNQRRLHLPENEEQMFRGFQSLDDTLNNVSNVTLKVANKIYIAKGSSIKDSFKEITRTNFHSESIELDFSDSTESAAIINKWSSDHTNNKIPEIVTSDDLDGTGLLLLNAVYFKGKWAHKFDKSLTELKPFHVSNTKTVNVPTMFLSNKLYYSDLSELNAIYVGIPYENEDLQMGLIIPKEIDGLKNIEENVDKIRLNRLFRRPVHLSLPKFKIESSIKLEKTLAKMGMSDMFTDRANFSGISNVPLKVESVIQKAFIEVNEEGSEAAAVSGTSMVFRSRPLPPLKIDVDRPFLYQIVDTKLSVPLFSGRIIEPKYEEM